MQEAAGLSASRPLRSGRKKKEPFSSEEDAKIREIVGGQEAQDWQSIAEQLPGRTARQCRERWKLYLSPDVNLEPWTVEDEDRLLKMYLAVGPKWTLIANNFPNRTPNNVKNRAKQSIRKMNRLYIRNADHGLAMAQTGHQQGPPPPA
jgi:hypothetical protein